MKKEKLSVRDLCITALFAAVTAICAQIAIPIPFSPVPISFGMVGRTRRLFSCLPAARCSHRSVILYLVLRGFLYLAGLKAEWAHCWVPQAVI